MNFGTIQVADIFVGAFNAIEAYFGNDKVWGKSEPATPNWLCFTAEEANSTVAMQANGSAPAVSLEYSTDGNTWSPFVVGTTTVTLANIGDKMYMRATSDGNTGMGISDWDYNQFVMTGKISASGNVDTLLDQNGNATITDYCYCGLFKECTSLTSAPELPATTLAYGCYREMFSGCTSLTTAPSILPSITLADCCYQSMFYGCTSLTQAPELPATTLTFGCYQQMFYNCTSLTTAPELPATTLADECYDGMFQSCKSLTSAPELPATELANRCYAQMFFNCSNINTIKLGYIGLFDQSIFEMWVQNVASSGTLYYNGSDTTHGTSAIPEGWTVTPFTS